jgi:AmmeMemoRadiSam system protein B
MQTIRQPAVAGLFYPFDAGELAQLVRRYTQGDAPASPPKMIIVPHAGYIYSGAIAGAAYAQLQSATQVRRVVLLGPSHRVALRGIAVPSVDRFATPLGEITIDNSLRDAITGLPGVIVHDVPHAQEHSLEVQLPFLQLLLPGGFTLLPLVVGDADPATVAAVLDAVWGGDETLVVISTDLSHYLPYSTARKVDAETSALIEGRNTQIHPEQACGAHPLNGALLLARRKNLQVECVKLANSGDTAGTRDRVVGYGAYVVR